MNAAAEVLTDHEHGLAGRAGVDVRTHAQASAVKSLIATVRTEEAVKQADLVQALKDCLEMLYLEGYLAGPGTTVADAEAALAKAGAQ